jgi:hypothetical protein
LTRNDNVVESANPRRGFGFAQMMDPSQAQAAIAHLDGVIIPGEGRQLVVRIAVGRCTSCIQLTQPGFELPIF